MHTGVIRNGDDHTGVDTCIGHRVERVGCNVQADMLHRAEGTLPGQGCPEGCFHCDFFIWRPFGIDVVIFCQFFGDLGARCTRVARREQNAGFVETPGNCLIAQH